MYDEHPTRPNPTHARFSPAVVDSALSNRKSKDKPKRLGSLLALFFIASLGCNHDPSAERPISNGFSASSERDAGFDPTEGRDASIIDEPGLNRFPTVGELRINEIFFDPNNGLEDLYGEWIEIINVSEDPLSLDDCNLADAAHQQERTAQADLHGIRLLPGEFVLAARSDDALLNGGLSPDVTFTFGLGNGGDTVILQCDGMVIDEVAYDSGREFPKGNGRSIQWGPMRWCPATDIYHEPTQQRGTPGVANTPCELDNGQCWSDLDCPDGQRCIDDVCDMPGQSELGCLEDADCDRDNQCRDGFCIQREITMGDVVVNELVISEFLYDPVDTLSDSKAEWIELKNTSDRRLSLSGCFVADNTDATHWASLEGIEVDAGDFVLVVRSDSMEENGGLEADGVFRFNLNNGGDDVRLICNDVVIDQITYGSGDLRASGASIARSGPIDGMANSSNVIWCVSERPYVDEPLHAGTPGEENPSCFQ